MPDRGPLSRAPATLEEHSHLKEAESTRRSKNPGVAAEDMRLVGIDFNPGPDAEDRLRRLFTILVKLADDDLPALSKESTPERSGGEEG